MTQNSSSSGTDDDVLTANDRFKNAFGNWLWGSMIAATVLHFALFAFFPEMSAADFSYDAADLTAIDLPPEIVVPPPPQQIARPATPIISETPISEDITIGETDFEDNPISELPKPTETREVDISEQPVFTPYTIRPLLTNGREVELALLRTYPVSLREAGIGGIAVVWCFIDEAGVVQNAKVHQSSGFDQLDQAALAVADMMVFTPAQNMDKKVPVWIQQPIEFKVGIGR